MSDHQEQSDWWRASDGKWYPPADLPAPPGQWKAAKGLSREALVGIAVCLPVIALYVWIRFD